MPRYVKLKGSITSLEQLESRRIVGTNELAAYKNARGIPFPILTNSYYADLIDPEDLNDPIRALIIPTKKELETYDEMDSEDAGSLDTSGEHTNWKAPGLQHKYGPTALALVSNICASLCRECFRKRLFINGCSSENDKTFPNDKALTYLKVHKEINTILLSGGDSFMLDNKSIQLILDELDHPELKHIRTVRFGSKIHAFYPHRIDRALCKILFDFQKKTGKSVHVCVHFEHPREMTAECIASLKLMRKYSIELYNQTVLLKGINDDPLVLYQLFEKMAKYGVRPYYLFQCRPVIGSKDMQLTLKQGIDIFNQLTQMMTGLHKPRYAMSTQLGKMEILGVNPANKYEVMLRLHSSKAASSTGDLIIYNVKENDPYWYEEKSPQPSLEKSSESVGMEY